MTVEVVEKTKIDDQDLSGEIRKLQGWLADAIDEVLPVPATFADPVTFEDTVTCEDDVEVQGTVAVPGVQEDTADIFVVGGVTFKRWHKTVSVSTGGATTTVGLTPAGVVHHAAIRVATAIAGLDSADHHVQLGVSGTADKYVDKANGGAATSIAKNTKDHYKGAPVYESAALILTLSGGSDNTPSAGAVEVEIFYSVQANLADVA